MTLKPGLGVTQGHWKYHPSIEHIRLPIDVLYSNYGSISCSFWDIQRRKMSWPWNRGQRSLKVIENYTIQSGTHDFVLTLHSNHRPILHRFRDKWRCTSKIANFPTPVYLTPAMKGFHVEFGIGVRGPKCLNDGPTRWSKKFFDRFSRFDAIPADRQTVSQPATSP